MIHLLDVNVLIALVDRAHLQHASAVAYFREQSREGWATCPMTENAFLRILGRTTYPGGPGSPDKARELLVAYCGAPGHQFWPDALSLADIRAFPELPASKHLTDFYLLALAVKRGARLATFDRRIDASLVAGGPQSYFVIPISQS